MEKTKVIQTQNSDFRLLSVYDRPWISRNQFISSLVFNPKQLLGSYNIIQLLIFFYFQLSWIFYLAQSKVSSLKFQCYPLYIKCKQMLDYVFNLGKNRGQELLICSENILSMKCKILLEFFQKSRTIEFYQN